MDVLVNGDFTMTNRTLVALGMTLLLAGPTFAQTPNDEQAPSPRTLSAEPSVSLASVSIAMVGPDTPEMGFASGASDPGHRFWMTGEGLIGWIQGITLPPLVTTSPQGTAQAKAGVLGLPTTTTLFGGPANEDARWGFRLGAGWWFDGEHTLGVEAGFTMMESESTIFAATSNGNPILARPFFNALTNKQDAVLVAFPNSTMGSLVAQASSGNFYEAHLDLVGNVVNQSWCRLDALFGYRFYNYDEGLRITSAITPTFQPGTQTVTVDQFSTQNTFNGFDFGLKAKVCWHDLSLDLLGKAAIGNVNREVSIIGSQTVSGANPAVNVGGLYALSSNIGIHNSHDWALLPEFGCTLNWQVWSHARLYLGYSFLMLEQIARAADQVDQRVNTDLLPPQRSTTGPSLPAFTLDRGDVWIQTFNFGVEFSF